MWLQKGIGRGHWLAMLFLRLLLCMGLGVQLIILIGILRDDAFPLPDALLEAAQTALEEKGIFFSTQDCLITSSGRIVLRDAALYSAPSQTETILTAKEIALRPSWTQLLLGKFDPVSLRIQQGELRCPAYLSPDGRNTPIVEHFDLNLVQRARSRWEISRAVAQIFNLRVAAMGDFFLPESAASKQTEPSPTSARPISLTTRIGDIAATLLKQKPIFEQFRHPQIFLRLQASRQQRRTRADIEIIADGWKLDQNSCGSISLSSAFWFGGRQITPADIACLELADACIQMPSQQEGNILRIGSLALCAYPAVHPARPEQFFKTADLYARGLDGFGASIRAIAAKAKVQKYPILSAKGRLSAGKGSVDFDIQADISAQTANISILSESDPRTLIPASLIHDEGVKSVRFGEAPLWQLSAALGPKWAFQSGRFSLDLFETDYQSVHLSGAFVKGKVDKNGLSTEILELWGKNFALGGAYLQDFKRNTYRFLLRGLIPPEQLDALMEPWWKDIWREFDIQNNPPYADIDFGGQWGNDLESKLVGEVRLNDFGFRSNRWEEGRVGIRRTPDYTAIDDIVLQNAEGTLSGDFRWFYKNDMRPRLMFLQQLSIRSTLPLPLLGIVGGPDVEMITRELSSERPPMLSGEFYTWGVGSAVAGDCLIDLSARFDGQGSVYKIPVEDLHLKARIDNRHVEISDIQLNLSRGTVSADLVLTGTPKGTQINFDFLVDGANHEQFLDDIAKMQSYEDAVKASQNTPQAQPAPAKPQIETKIAKGDGMRLEAVGSGVFGHTDSFNGQGNVRIRNAEIGRIDLLGALSRFLEKSSLPSAQLRFTDAASTLRLEKGVLVFPDLTLSGPISKIAAAGRLSLINQNLDFNIRIYPIGSMDSRLVKTLSAAVRPLSNTFAISLHGTTQKPEWEWDFSPSQIFEFDYTHPDLPEEPSQGSPPN